MSLTPHDEHVLELILGDRGAESPALDIPRTKISADEAAAVQLAEAGEREKALDALTRLIAGHPLDPSPRNNRAQVYRMQHEDRLAEADLQACLELCAGNEHRGVRRQALMQLGWLKLKTDGEEAAGPFFQEAAQLGSQEARRLAVRCNPYAAMCNQMLRQMMSHYFSTPDT